MQTIAAIATPPGKGGIAVIRVSGDRAFDVADAVFRARSGRRIREIRPRTAVFGDILDPRTGETLDSGVCTAFFAPHSYTGEDTVELSCHGGTLVTTLVLSACFAAGAVQAGPGEFTKRAFLSGKLSLTEAEAVGLLIDADTEEKRKLSTSAVRGVTSRAIAELDEGLFSVMTALYAAIDYPEEDVGDEGERNIRAVVDATLTGVERLLATYKTGRAVAEGVKTVLCGAPNAGKSSLFNAMLGEDAAIVTQIAGTTRDVLRETVSFGGVTLRLSDTAGVRGDGAGDIERLGIDRAKREIAGAQLILTVIDGGTPLGADTRATIALYPACPRIAVVNKADLGCALTENDRTYLCETHDAVVPVSCATGAGLDALAAEIGALWGSDRVTLGRDAVIWDPRQHAALTRAAIDLREAAAALDAGDAIDAVCTFCESALAAIREVDGREVNADIADEVFRRFCVGK